MPSWAIYGNERRMGPGPASVTVAQSYTGPGDIVSGAVIFYGLRSYSAAKAAAGPYACIDIVDSSNANAATINILTTGSLDMATLNAWITLHGTPSTVKYYDQIGTRHLTDRTALVANEPTIVVGSSGLNAGYPLMRFGVSGTQGLDDIALGSTLTQAQPFTISHIIRRNVLGALTLSRIFFNSGDTAEIGFNTANTVIARSTGGRLTASATDGQFHSVQAVYADATQSALFVDATNTNITLGDTTSISGANLLFGAGAFPIGNSGSTADVLEYGIWPSAFSTGGGGQAALMNANQLAYWNYS